MFNTSLSRVLTPFFGGAVEGPRFLEVSAIYAGKGQIANHMPEIIVHLFQRDICLLKGAAAGAGAYVQELPDV